MNYTALTIGPIHKTLQSGRSTKAIWTASYMFSYLMKEIIKKIKNESDNVEFILPYSGEVKINENSMNPLSNEFRIQTGILPDRIIFTGTVRLQQIIDNVLMDFSLESGLSLDYLKNYINIYHLEIELDKSANVILQINELLDSLELQQKVLDKSDDDSLNNFLEKKNPYNFLINTEFQKRPFPSTIEIATAEFSEKYKDNKKYKTAINNLKQDDVENQIDFVKDIRAIVGESFRNYQKYIAVVQADGDNMGSFISLLYSQDFQSNKNKLIEQFSKNLLSFSIESVELIKKNNGTPIYAGGDDLLYFVPVAQTLTGDNKIVIGKTIFDLISEIDELFKKYFTNYDQDGIDFSSIIQNAEKKPSMSYGVSISYYKFPLNEALEEGLNQLFYKAKKTEKKNAISFVVLKHSGQYFGTTFHKDTKSYITFRKLIAENLDKSDFITSIIHKIEPQKYVMQAIGIKSQPDRDIILDNFFLNNFNENIHRQKSNKEKLIPFLDTTKQLFKDVYSENELISSKHDIDEQNDINLKKIYSGLRYIEFINNKEERDE